MLPPPIQYITEELRNLYDAEEELKRQEIEEQEKIEEQAERRRRNRIETVLEQRQVKREAEKDIDLGSIPIEQMLDSKKKFKRIISKYQEP